MHTILYRLLSPSTRQFVEEWRTTGGSLMELLHGYAYLRWTYLYIDVARGDHRLSNLLEPLGRWIEKRAVERAGEASGNGEGSRFSWGDTYHGKVVPLEAATQLIRVDRDIALECPERVIPYPVARDIILKNPDHIVVLDCPCRASRKEPCAPLDVCLIVGEPFASFAQEHHPGRSRRITRDEAEQILKEEDERGHVHHAFFKDAMLGRFYAICNCFKCCCGAMQSHQHGSNMLASSGYVAEVDESMCEVCGDCNDYCQFDALSTQDLHTNVDGARCMGCGICVSKCAYGAISLVRDPSKGDPLEVMDLLKMPAEMEAELPAVEQC